MVESSEFALSNLGLSLTDYYWVKPVQSSLTWEDVNLFDNDFKKNLLVRIDDASPGSHTPNSTLQGQLEKSWQIRNGKRILIKGNTDVTSSESINEVFACFLHKKQRYRNYTYPVIFMKTKFSSEKPRKHNNISQNCFHPVSEVFWHRKRTSNLV